MKPGEIKKIKSRIIATIAKELGDSDKSDKKDPFGKYAKTPHYRLYGKNHFIKDAPGKKKGK